MAEENNTPKITSIKKEKDPCRVEAGRKLAEISNAVQERKIHEKLNLRDKMKTLNGILIIIIYSV